MTSPAPRDQPESTTPGRRIRVAVVFGGRSTEHQISCISAGGVLRALDPGQFEVIPVGITPKGQWVLVESDTEQLALTGAELPSLDDQSGAPVIWTADPSRQLSVHEPGQVPEVLGDVDVVFPLLHGPYGEDGTIQGLLELAGVPYVGSGVLASAAAMDKAVAKVLIAAAGIQQARHVVITDRQWTTDRVGALESARSLRLPVFVKPSRAGSSVGISRVGSWDDLEPAIEAARQHDPKIVIEQGVVGREIECGVLSAIDGSGPEASLPAEIHIKGEHEFYDFDAKYLDDITELTVPADLPPDVTKRVQEAACAAFDAIGCEDYARVDFFVTDDGDVVLNEINTIPGFTPISLFPQMWAATGIDYPELVARMVRAALTKRRGLR
ncbi:MAG TPA: D-alanine--D-alanine ligase family protein [Actinomycetes bacterium]|nr:D-alanine--D-alanine ligase family protein [Actinomycetes bacterium]